MASNLRDHLVEVLRDAPLSVAEIRRQLRLKAGKAPTPEALQRALEADRFRRLPGDKYLLVEHVVEAAPMPSTSASASIWRLADLGPRFAIVDVETTGPDPQKDRVFQVAAVLFEDGRPVRSFNRYMSPAPAAVPTNLVRKLGLDDPTLARQVADAAPPDQVLPAIRDAIDGLPWVAHNARFDRAFLEQLGLSTPFHVDTLELAGLALPLAPSLSQEAIAEALEIEVGTLGAAPELQLALEALDGPALFGTYHNALTDVLALAIIFDRLRGRLPAALNEAISRRARGEAPCPAAVWDPMIAGDSRAEGRLRPPALLPSFDPASALESYLTARGRSCRASQVRLVELLASALAAGEPCACEAPTGTGKTLGYVFPALAAAEALGQKVCIATATKNLQDQLVDELADVEEWGGLPFRWAIVKGSGNYLCRVHLRRRLGELQAVGERAPDDDVYAALFWTAFLLADGDATLDAGPWVLARRFPAIASWRDEIRATMGCNLDDGTAHAACGRASAYAAAERADLVVMNHALWLSGAGGLTGFGVVIADEAHDLESVATSCLETEVTAGRARYVLRRLYDAGWETGLLPIVAAEAGTLPSSTGLQARVRAAIAATRRAQGAELPAFGHALREFARRLRLADDPRYGTTFEVPPFPARTLSARWLDVQRAWRDLASHQLEPLVEALEAIVEALSGRPPLARALAGVAGELRRLLDDAGAVLEPRNRRFVHVVELAPPTEDDGEGWTLRRTPIDVSETLATAYGDLPTAFLSATLETGGDGMAYALDRVGLGFVPPHRRHVLPPALPYAENAVFAIARAMDHAPMAQTMRGFTKELASAWSRLLGLTGGRALLLFTARARLELVVPMVAEQAPAVPLLVQGEDQPHRLLKRFRDDPRTVLAGLRRFWQGVDVQGESLSFVFMEKLPFPSLGDPVVRARTKLVEERGGSGFDDYLLPGMLIAFKQGFGRLVRAKDDRGAVVLFDRRVAAKTYLPRLLAALPGFVPRDPDAERSWGGLIRHLDRHLPGLLGPVEDWGDLPAAAPPVPEIDGRSATEAERETALAAGLAAFGFQDFQSPVQRAITEHQLAGRDVLGLMPTGAGKSLTFQLPALIGRGLTIVISPLIALMRDQVEGLQARGFEWGAALYAGQPSSERLDVLGRVRSGRLKLLYVSPERLRDPVLLEALRATPVRSLVIDEAHCLYAWGPHFRPEFLYVRELFRHVGQVPIAALTATAPPARRREMLDALGLDPSTAVVTASFARPELRYVVYGPTSRFNTIRGPQDKLRALLKILTAAERDGDSAIVYVATTGAAELLASQLQLARIDARAYHGRMTPAARHGVQDLFMDDHIRVVVCTNAFGMGVDKRGVRYVIHYDVPGDLVAYAQESGRAGRGVSPEGEAWCVLLYYPGDDRVHRFFAAGKIPDLGRLERVAADILAEAAGAPTVYYDVADALERLGGELEETEIRVALHRLIELGMIGRGVDVVTRAFVYQLEGSCPDPDPAAIRTFAGLPTAAELPAPERRQAEDLDAMATRLGLTLEALNATLARLAVGGAIVYSPIRRSASLAIRTEAVPAFPPTFLARLQAEALTGWDGMQAWAEQQAGCRTQALLAHLGEPGEPGPCGRCDLCTPTAPRPWGSIADDDVPRPIEHLEVAGMLLEAIAWNAARTANGSTPAGDARLWATLTADEYWLRRFGGLEAARRAPYFGRFRSFPGRSDGLTRLAGRLAADGYVEARGTVLDTTDGGISYTYFAPTARGLRCLAEGAFIEFGTEDR